MTNITVTVLLILASPLAAQRLDPSGIEYVGSFNVPTEYGWRNRGLTLIPDCLGRPDPTPNDGYPGCIGAFVKSPNTPPTGSWFGLYDIVPPGGRAQNVVMPYDLSDGMPEEQLGFIGSEQAFDVLYDKGPSHCRLWWTYGTWYAGVQNDPPFLGYSSCDATNPDPRGMWDVGKEYAGKIEDDPFHTAKMYMGLSEIPAGVADAHFDGNRMMIGTPFYDGSVGSSQGPTAYVRPFDVPTENPILDVTPTIWYRRTSYMKWNILPELIGGEAGIRHWPLSFALGGEFIDTAEGSAFVLPWQAPTIKPNDYPCSIKGTPEDIYTGKAKYPQPCEVPVCYYGVRSCRQGPADLQQPSFWEFEANGINRMPKDCNIEGAREGTGPHCLSIEYSLILYDLDDLGAAYRGEVEHNDPQPYAQVSTEGTGFATSRLHGGTTYDPSRQLMYVGSGGPRPSVYIFSIGQGLPQRGE